ncbi:MAG: shikimate kinase [Acidobacteriaceae bacterium]
MCNCVGFGPIFLTGFMGCGKTTIGKLAAEQLGLQFFDLDCEIERRTRQSIAGLFEQGESYFREHEHRVLFELLGEIPYQPCLIALGGGTSVQPGNEPLIRPERLIFLDVPFPVIEGRLAICTDRPLAHNVAELKRLHEERAPLYSRAKTILALSDKDDQMQAARKLIACVHELLKSANEG